MAGAPSAHLPLLEEQEARRSTDALSGALPSRPEIRSNRELASFLAVASRAVTPESAAAAEGTVQGEYEITLQIAEKESAEAIVNLLEHRYVTDPHFRELAASRVGGAVGHDQFESELKARFREFFASKWRERPFDAAFLNTIDGASQDLLFRNCGTIQLTDGCSIACSFCGFGAPKGVRLFFSYDDLKRIVVTHAREFFAKNSTFFYWASDPFDWRADPAWSPSTLKYPDIHKLVQFYGNYPPFVSTAVPKGEEATVRQHFDVVNRVSVSFMNEARLKKAWPGINFGSFRFRKVQINPELNEKTRGKRGVPGADESDPSFAIGCVDGVLLTPRGFFNLVQFGRVVPRYPEGQVTVQIDPKRFNEPLPDGPVPIEDLLQRAVVSHKFLLGWNECWDEVGLKSRCMQISNSSETRAFVFDGERGIAVPVGDREMRWYKLLTEESLAVLAPGDDYGAFVKEVLYLREMEKEELNPLLFDREKAHTALRESALSYLGRTLVQWADRFDFFEHAELGSRGSKTKPSAVERCSHLRETVRILRESREIGTDPLFAEYSDEQIAAGLLLYLLADTCLRLTLKARYYDSPETYDRLREQASAVDGAVAVFTALRARPS